MSRSPTRMWMHVYGRTRSASFRKLKLRSTIHRRKMFPSIVRNGIRFHLSPHTSEKPPRRRRAACSFLAVMLDSGPYLEQAESRLRARQAVLEGLSENNFIPVDGDYIGFVFEKKWPLLAKQISADSPARDASLLFAWEQCSRAGDSKKPPNGTGAENDFEQVFVLWLPAARLNPNPLGNFASLITELAPQLVARMIGPANSTGLQAMIREIKAWKQEKIHKFAYGNALDKVSIFSARATASDDWLLGYPLPEGRSLEDEIGRRCVAEWLGQSSVLSDHPDRRRSPGSFGRGTLAA
jgi:hypothetical protein